MEEKYVIKYTYINVTLIYTYFYIYFIIEIFNIHGCISGRE